MVPIRFRRGSCRTTRRRKLLSNGVDLRTAAGRLGHSERSLTRDRTALRWCLPKPRAMGMVGQPLDPQDVGLGIHPVPSQLLPGEVWCGDMWVVWLDAGRVVLKWSPAAWPTLMATSAQIGFRRLCLGTRSSGCCK